MARKSLLFEKALHTVSTNRMVEGAVINMVDSRVLFKIIAERSFNMKVQQHKVNTSLENLKEILFPNNLKLVPLTSTTLIHPAVRKLFTEEITNVPLAGRPSAFKTVRKKHATKKLFLHDSQISQFRGNL